MQGEHPLAGQDVERVGDVRRRGDDLRREDDGRRLHAASLHLLAERGEADLEVDLGRCDERAPTLLAVEEPLDDERVDGLPDRHPRHPELLAEEPLGRDGVPRRELVRDERAQIVAHPHVLQNRAPHLRPSATRLVPTAEACRP
ncbi:hypothetical protein GALL_433540 [mine drainage metagenome]|uniref:Uncharacterized protein n=1 Tax=mine drainage metagenome TaxID=410659 RepID=A0A1J5Q4S4_9ZZZZ